MGSHKKSLGTAISLADEHTTKHRSLMLGEVEQIVDVQEIMTCKVIDSQTSILDVIGIGDDDTNTMTLYPWHLGYLLGVSRIGNYSRHVQTERTQHVALCICRSHFRTQLQESTQTLTDMPDPDGKTYTKDAWHCFLGTLYVSSLLFGGVIDLNVKVKLVQEVDDSRAVLGTVSRIIADTFNTAAKGEDQPVTYLRSALSDYEEAVTITVSAKSQGVTPEGFGMQFSLLDLVGQVKDFRTKVDNLPHDPNKYSVVGFIMKSAQHLLRQSLPHVALSMQDELKVRDLLARASRAMFDLNFFIASIQKCKDGFRRVIPTKSYFEIDNRTHHLETLLLTLTCFVQGGVLHMLQENFPEEAELDDEQKITLSGWMGRGSMSATEFVGRTHPDNLCFEGYIIQGEPVFRGAILERDGSIWASGGVTHLQKMLKASIERHEAYPAFMDLYKLASNNKTLGACGGRRKSGFKNDINADKR